MRDCDQTIVILCSTPSQQIATELASQLIDSGYAACCNVLPGVISVYRWNNERQVDQECLLVIKAVKKRYKQIEEFIRRHHPYELPECIALPITAGSTEYLQWIKDQVA